MTASAIAPTPWPSRSAATRAAPRTPSRKPSYRSGRALGYRPQQGTVAAWLLAVVRYRAIDLVRSQSNHAARWASDDQLSDRPALDDVSEAVVQLDSAEHLHRSLVMLSDEQREVITLAYYGQLLHTEIAAQLGIPSGTVKGRMRLGLQKLRATTNDAAA